MEPKHRQTPLEKKCTANRSAGAGPCNNYRVKGTSVCRKHGGAAPQVKRAAQVKLAREQVQKAVITYGLAVDVSPTQALLDEVRWTAGHVAWLRVQVQALEQSAIGWNLAQREDKNAVEFTGSDFTYAAVPHVLIDLYQRERKHLVDVCKAAISAGIEERHLQMAERQGEVLAVGLHKVFDALSLTIDQRSMLPDLVPKMLTEIRGDWVAK